MEDFFFITNLGGGPPKNNSYFYKKVSWDLFIKGKTSRTQNRKH